MLYTVSAVQVLVTLDAVDELEKRGLGGKRKVASCMILLPTLL
jgi:geranylgeranyl transferase type-2 subunit beta